MGRTVELLVAGALILLGGLFLLLNFVGAVVTLEAWWPVFIIIPGVALFVPVVVVKNEAVRRALAALAIPGTVVTTLGAILLYSTLSTHWVAWSYLWALLPASVGLGLLIAGTAGGWGPGVFAAGRRLLGVGLLVAAGLGAIFEVLVFGGLAERYWPVLLILIGILQLLWMFWPRQRAAWLGRQGGRRI